MRRPFANEEGANRWFAYPRWSKDEKVIVYHASPSLYIYNVEGHGSTVPAKVSTARGGRLPLSLHDDRWRLRHHT
jgi:hypothetical protein